VESLLRPAHVVPENKSLAGLLADFRRSKSHMALVIDEYGSLAGIATLEDLIEEIVGEIDDEHDRPERPLERISEGHIRVDGKFSVEELNERFGLELPSDDYHTIGGVVFGLLGQAPHEGDVVRIDGVRMEVVETDGPRIVHVDIIMRERHGHGAQGADDGEQLGDVSGLDPGDPTSAHSDDDDFLPGADSRRATAAAASSEPALRTGRSGFSIATPTSPSSTEMSRSRHQSSITSRNVPTTAGSNCVPAFSVTMRLAKACGCPER
jgi:hypothetical protein